MIASICTGANYLDEVVSCENIIIVKYIKEDEKNYYVVIDILKGGVSKDLFQKLSLFPEIKPNFSSSKLILWSNEKADRGFGLIPIRQNLFVIKSLENFKDGFHLNELYKKLGLDENNHKTCILPPGGVK